MFPLSGTDFPTTPDALAAAIARALSTVFTLPAGKPAVRAEGGQGGAFPAIERLTLDLDGADVGAALTATTLPPRPTAVGDRQPGPTVGTLTLSGRPITYQSARLNLDLAATGLAFDYARDAAGHPLLVLTDAHDGTVNAAITQADLRAALLAAASQAAKAQGVVIQDLAIDLQPLGPRALAASVRVQAKKLFMSGVIHLRGQVAVDDDLCATVSHLAATGEGVVGSMAAGVLQPKLRAQEGKKIPLTAFSLGDVKLRDLKLDVDPAGAPSAAVRVSAAFGRSA